MTLVVEDASCLELIMPHVGRLIAILAAVMGFMGLIMLNMSKIVPELLLIDLVPNFDPLGT